MTEPASQLATRVRRPRSAASLALLALVSLVFALFGGASLVAAQDGGTVTVTPNDQLEGCDGVRNPPGNSPETTTITVVGGTLTAGGTVIFELNFPADENQDEESQTFEIDDCLFLEDTTAIARWTIIAENQQVQEGRVIFQVTLELPADQTGTNFCNHAKHTGEPPGPQGGERKAVACFFMAGELNVLKTDAEGNALGGAVFNLACSFPETESFLPETVVEAIGGMVSDQADGAAYTSTSGGSLDIDVTTGDSGLIYVRAPGMTECTFTETQPPEGHDLADPVSTTLTVAVGDPQSYTFENPPTAGQAPEAPESTPPAPTEPPNTASEPMGGGPLSVPLAALLLLVTVGAMGSLAYAQVRARR